MVDFAQSSVAQSISVRKYTCNGGISEFQEKLVLLVGRRPVLLKDNELAWNRIHSGNSEIRRLMPRVTGWIFLQQLFRMAKSCTAVRFTRFWDIVIFNTNISQGSVTTHLRCDGIFNYCFISNLLSNLTTSEFWESAYMWQNQSETKWRIFSGHDVYSFSSQWYTAVK